MRIFNLLFVAVAMVGSAGYGAGQPGIRIAFLAGSSEQMIRNPTFITCPFRSLDSRVISRPREEVVYLRFLR